MKKLSIFKYSKFKFGRQHVSQFILFEHKDLFSIIFFYFHKSKYSQDRFHTHAFNALSIKFFGSYTEHVLIQKKPTENIIKHKRDSIFKYFAKNSYHKIGQSTGCMTMLLSGPWEKTWEEYLENGETITYNQNRIIV